MYTKVPNDDYDNEIDEINNENDDQILQTKELDQFLTNVDKSKIYLKLKYILIVVTFLTLIGFSIFYKNIFFEDENKMELNALETSTIGVLDQDLSEEGGSNDYDFSNLPGGKRIPVCVTAAGGKANPRHASMYVRNYLHQFGSILDFKLSPSIARTLDQYFEDGTLEKKHLNIVKFPCDPKWPRLNLFPHESMTSAAMRRNPGAYLMVGDEYCLCTPNYCGDATHDHHKVEMRNYYSSRYNNIWIPLGPQFWFDNFNQSELTQASKRKYSFNFAGSITSRPRIALAALLHNESILNTFPQMQNSKVKIKKRWSSNLNSKGYIKPEQYRQLLADSTFTLCPKGQNQEAFRIYEAIEAGSIPVMSLDGNYKHDKCSDAFQPLIDSGAPFVFIKKWNTWPITLEKLMADPKKLDKLQKQMLIWRNKFYKNISRTLECKILSTHNNRKGNIIKYDIPFKC